MKTILVDAAYTLTIETPEGFVVDERLVEILDGYENKKIIVTNASEEQKSKFGLTDLPYELFSLSHKPDKDDPKYFGKLLQHYKLNPDEVIYFEHSQDAVESALSAGITSYYFDHNSRDYSALVQFIEQNL